jgi:hypothetical protein
MPTATALCVSSEAAGTAPYTTAQRLWHGGAPDLRPGDPLLPPAVTGAYSRRQISLEEGLPNIAQRDDLVYATTDRELARAWASFWTRDGQQYGGGSLYVVDLEDPQPDEDLLSTPDLSWQARTGRVLQIYDSHVAFDRKYLRILQRVATENDRRRGAGHKPA